MHWEYYLKELSLYSHRSRRAYTSTASNRLVLGCPVYCPTFSQVDDKLVPTKDTEVLVGRDHMSLLERRSMVDRALPYKGHRSRTSFSYRHQVFHGYKGKSGKPTSKGKGKGKGGRGPHVSSTAPGSS